MNPVGESLLYSLKRILEVKKNTTINTSTHENVYYPIIPHIW